MYWKEEWKEVDQEGDPRINWEDNVKNWSGLKLQECTRMAEDLVKWRDVAINLRTGRRYLDRYNQYLGWPQLMKSDALSKTKFLRNMHRRLDNFFFSNV